jgi:KDO2-lipid IV(A) lauroyltransferase
MMLDLFWFSRHTADRVARYVIKDASFDRVRTTKPCILVTAHMGNWEVLGLATGMECGDVLSVASPLENPVADRVLNSVRVSTGQKIVQRQGAVRALLGWLRDGKRVALLLDQNTVPRDGGVFVDFFGLPVPVSRMPGAMHVRTGAAILPVFCTPEPGGYYRAWTLEPLARSCENCPELEATRRIMRAIEGVIRQRPGDWLWMYRRWKYLPPGGPVSGYPRYARDLRDYELSVNGRDQENWTQ